MNKYSLDRIKKMLQRNVLTLYEYNILSYAQNLQLSEAIEEQII